MYVTIKKVLVFCNILLVLSMKECLMHVLHELTLEYELLEEKPKI